MRKVHYYVVASWSEIPKMITASTFVVSGEEQLAIGINDFVNRKLKKLKFDIRRLSAEEIKTGAIVWRAA